MYITIHRRKCFHNQTRPIKPKPVIMTEKVDQTMSWSYQCSLLILIGIIMLPWGQCCSKAFKKKMKNSASVVWSMSLDTAAPLNWSSVQDPDKPAYKQNFFRFTFSRTGSSYNRSMLISLLCYMIKHECWIWIVIIIIPWIHKSHQLLEEKEELLDQLRIVQSCHLCHETTRLVSAYI